MVSRPKDLHNRTVCTIGIAAVDAQRPAVGIGFSDLLEPFLRRALECHGAHGDQ